MKYIIFDLDDTILRKDKTISEFTLKVLKELQNRGHKIVFDTARSFNHSKQYIDLINPDYAIVCAGALITNKDNNHVYENYIDNKILKELTLDLFKHCIKMSVETGENFFSSDKEYKGQNSKYYDFSNGYEGICQKIVVMCNDKKYIKGIAEKYNLAYESYFGGNWYRLNAKGVSKWDGILALLNLDGGSINDTITFGDDYGDESMLLNASVGVCMENGQESIKEKVKYIAPNCDDDGVAKFLNALFNLQINN